MLLFITLFLIPWMKILSYRFNLSHRKVFFWCSVFISYQSSVLALFVGEITKFYRFKVRVTLLWCFLLWCCKSYWLSMSRQSLALPWKWKLARRFFMVLFYHYQLSIIDFSDFPGEPKRQSWKSVCFLWTLHQCWLSNSEYLHDSFDRCFLVCNLVCLLLSSLFFLSTSWLD